MITLTTDCRNLATASCSVVILFCLIFHSFSDEALAQSTDQANVPATLDDPALAPPDPESPTADELDQDVLMRGPVHEAFAAAHQLDAVPSPLVDSEPPELIEEVPPDYRPEGTNVQWIPGYWAWDESRSDFVWVSGIWRDVPPGRRWVPGYWESVDSAYRWISGFWAEQESERLAYLPPPPTSVDQGPSTPAPGENFFYVPGNWDYYDGNYRWISGHWRPIVNNWIWIPTQYVWTPSGYICIPGYWDYEIAWRGVCFAPVYFRRAHPRIWVHRYTPRFVINLNIDFLPHLFIRRGCRHYYFGNWYAQRYATRGFVAWATYQQHYRRYDPLVAYYRCRKSAVDPRLNVVTWAGNQHQLYARNQRPRPASTYAQHIKRLQSSAQIQQHQQIKSKSYVSSYQQVLENSRRKSGKSVHIAETNRQFRKINYRERSQNQEAIKQMVDLQRQRRTGEFENLPTKRTRAQTTARSPQEQFKATRRAEVDRKIREGISKAPTAGTNQKRQLPQQREITGRPDPRRSNTNSRSTHPGSGVAGNRTPSPSQPPTFKPVTRSFGPNRTAAKAIPQRERKTETATGNPEVNRLPSGKNDWQPQRPQQQRQSGSRDRLKPAKSTRIRAPQGPSVTRSKNSAGNKTVGHPSTQRNRTSSQPGTIRQAAQAVGKPDARRSPTTAERKPTTRSDPRSNTNSQQQQQRQQQQRQQQQRQQQQRQQQQRQQQQRQQQQRQQQQRQQQQRQQQQRQKQEQQQQRRRQASSVQRPPTLSNRNQNRGGTEKRSSVAKPQSVSQRSSGRRTQQPAPQLKQRSRQATGKPGGSKSKRR